MPAKAKPEAATAQVCESVETEAAPVTGCATGVAQPKPKIIPSESRGTGLDDISKQEARNLKDDALISECKRRVELAFASQRRLCRDASNLDVLYEEMVARFRCQNLKGKKRDGKPTLKEAFGKANWPYDAARKFHQRFQNWKKKQLVTKDDKPERLHLSVGDTIENHSGEYVVKALSDGDMQAIVAKKTEGEEEETTTAPVQLYDDDGIPAFEKVSSAKPINVGDLVVLTDMESEGAEYRYDGNLEFVRTKTPSVADKKRDDAARKEAVRKRAVKTPLHTQHTLDGDPIPPSFLEHYRYQSEHRRTIP
jgi:hypothetical protein